MPPHLPETSDLQGNLARKDFCVGEPQIRKITDGKKDPTLSVPKVDNRGETQIKLHLVSRDLGELFPTFVTLDGPVIVMVCSVWEIRPIFSGGGKGDPLPIFFPGGEIFGGFR